jgi:hypothetical protein
MLGEHPGVPWCLSLVFSGEDMLNNKKCVGKI